jgi:Tfp pilus assembly protein PilF
MNAKENLIRAINAAQLPAALKPLTIIALGQLSENAAAQMADYLERTLKSLRENDRATLHAMAIELADKLADEYADRVQ